MNPTIIEAVTKIASEDAKLFFSEFQEQLDPEQTDWDSVAWSESSRVVTEVDEGANPDDYWETYQDALVEETERLADFQS